MKAIQKLFITCSNCGKGFDVVQATKKTRGKELRCPHCKTHVGTINN